MVERDNKLRKNIEDLLQMFSMVEHLEKRAQEQLERIDFLEKENRKLKYEYEDSLLERDNPLPYKWGRKGGYFQMFCPKCELPVSNWFRYCPACGQKIENGNPLPEMEIENE